MAATTGTRTKARTGARAGARTGRKRAVPYALLAPAVVGLLAFSFYPFLSGIWYSFTDIEFVGDQAAFVGLQVYQSLLESTDIGAGELVKDSAVRSIFWTAAVVAGQLVMGMLTALVLNQRFRGRLFFRTAVLVPIAVPLVILTLTWQWMYDPLYGMINHYLEQFGLIDGPKPWILQPGSSLWPLIIVGIWVGFPFMSLMLLSGMQGIDPQLHEAAKVDGANAFERFRFITLPQMRTVITIAVILHILWWWNQFEILIILGTGAGGFSRDTMTLPILSWFEAFRWSHLSRGAAIAVISMLFLIAVIAWNARRELRSVKQ